MDASEKAFVITVLRVVEGYWSSRFEDDVSTGRKICLMARQSIEFDEGYWSSRSEEDYDCNARFPVRILNMSFCIFILGLDELVAPNLSSRGGSWSWVEEST